MDRAAHGPLARAQRLGFRPTWPISRSTSAGLLRLGLLAGACALAAVGPGASAQDAKPSGGQIAAATAGIDGAWIAANTATSKDWPTYGLDYAETRFSKLNQINETNVKDLGLAWTYDLESTRGVEATPLVVDGVMYVTASWSVVHAIDVRTGKRLWSFDPEVDKALGYRGCCDVVNRGVALYRGKVFVGAYDGRLIALDAATGKKAWEKDTIVNRSHSYTITGAPRVVKGNVVIGNGGAEFGARGYVTAYDAETGAQKWRWFTVPGDPSKPFEDESMAMAAKTWDPAGKYWVNGGGGTVWDSMVFDPELNLLYLGTGNGSPWSAKLRSPAGGDNLFLSSIVALNADTGQYAWHYQETPADDWDYTATQTLILADLQINGAPRKVIMHAPKNGFFYVIDRASGQFISAKNFVDVNWAKGYDDKGRPIETADARGRDKSTEAIPGPYGAHNWHPMSFNPQAGLAYIPAQNIPLTLMDDKEWVHNSNKPGQPQTGTGWNTAMFINATPPQSKIFGRLIAWDPVQQKEAWRVEHVSPWNGGTLTTAGNLVFQGTADGRFIAYNAKTGEKLWESPTGTGVVAAPSTYVVDGKQYVSVAVGWGGAYGQAQRATNKVGPGTVFTFVAGGKAPLPKFAEYQTENLLAGVKYDPADVPHGTLLYVSNCAFCHGVPGVDRGGNIRNLGYVPREEIEHLESIVFKGPFMERGMPDFTGKLTPADVVKIKAFIQGTADAVRPQSSQVKNN
ncbi:PQQ-dependent dehydrogenase, methanol/ethanol family [Chelatococcus reniformis]|uniref:Alcohol dehydrogenase n=1 Tax=Chelatococcus reniformis TaxID=1494448 RepID=A0A916URD4_9HYPH|nr:PQQ-dependent dehydrogenase, methanol/ethanol family [Chelatococcus reniformis]GGC84647.1 alcohol dehydrogenase [Chelatococcus reniformis]